MVFEFLIPFRKGFRGTGNIIQNSVDARKNNYENRENKDNDGGAKDSANKIYIQDPMNVNNILVAEEIGYVYGDPRDHIQSIALPNEEKAIQTVPLNKKFQTDAQRNRRLKSTTSKQKNSNQSNFNDNDLLVASKLVTPREDGDYIIYPRENFTKLRNKSVSFKDPEKGISSISSTLLSDAQRLLYGNRRNAAIDSQDFLTMNGNSNNLRAPGLFPKKSSVGILTPTLLKKMQGTRNKKRSIGRIIQNQIGPQTQHIYQPNHLGFTAPLGQMQNVVFPTTQFGLPVNQGGIGVPAGFSFNEVGHGVPLSHSINQGAVSNSLAYTLPQISSNVPQSYAVNQGRDPSNMPFERRASFDGPLPPVRVKPNEDISSEFFSQLYQSNSQPNLTQASPSSSNPVLPPDPEAASNSSLKVYDDTIPLNPVAEDEKKSSAKKGWSRVRELTIQNKRDLSVGGIDLDKDFGLASGKGDRVPGTKVPVVLLQGFFKGLGEKAELNRRRAKVNENKSLPKTLVESNSLLRGALPLLPIPLALLCLLFNIIIPGFGTFLSGWFGFCKGRTRMRIEETGEHQLMSIVVTAVTGALQLFTVTFFFVGWFWSICWGIILVTLANKYQQFQAQQRKSKRKEDFNVLTVNA